MENKVFILSTGRSGTNYISNKIEALNISSENIHQDKMSRRINILANIALHYPWAEKKLLKILNNKPFLLNNFIDPLKSVAFCFYLKELKKNSPDQFKDAIIIHLVRDPRDFVRSFINWKNRKLSGKIAHHLVPFWMPKPKSNLFNKLLMSKFEHYCWTWNIKNKLFHDTFKDDENYHLIRFEDLIKDDEVFIGLMRKIYQCNIEQQDLNAIDSIDQNATEQKLFPKWTKWNKQMSKKLNSICGQQMSKYGYGKETEWLEKIKHD